MGTITMALENSKPLLAMPRRKKYGEVVNDHQVTLAIKYEALGHILLARDEMELADKVAGLKSFVPRPRKVDPEAVARRIDVFLDQV
jgi:UDP-N-acetylglucosamine transferase subunit ALG13